MLCVCWMSTSFGFYMLAYVLKYLNGSIFLNAYSSSAGEIIGKLSTIPLLRCISLRQVFLIAFTMASGGTLLLLIFRDAEGWIPMILVIARFGFSQAFVASYLSFILVYPTILTSTAIGIAVTMSKCATIFAPVIAEVESPKNLIILLSISVTALIVSQCLQLGEKGSPKSSAKEDEYSESEQKAIN